MGFPGKTSGVGCDFLLQARHHELNKLKELLFEEITTYIFPGWCKDIGSQNEFKQKINKFSIEISINRYHVFITRISFFSFSRM